MKPACALLVVGLLASCSGAGEEVATFAAAPAAAWMAMPAAPLPARYDAVAVAVGDEVLFFGGTDAPPCPPNAGCAAAPVTELRDAAAFDVVSLTWREMAPAPRAISFASTAVIDDVVHLLVHDALLTYDVSDDRWGEAPWPGTNRRLVAAGDRLVAYVAPEEHSERGAATLDPDSGAWTPLPDDPLSSAFDRTMVWTDERLVLIDVEAVEQPNGPVPSLYRAASLDLDTGRWDVLPPSDVVASSSIWVAVDGRVVNPATGTLDGGEVNSWGRDIPVGGMLDIGAREWLPLPDRDERYGRARTGLTTAVGDRVLTSDGWVLDLGERAWRELPKLDDRGGAAAAVVRDTLVVWGGHTGWEAGAVELLDEGWTLRLS